MISTLLSYSRSLEDITAPRTSCPIDAEDEWRVPTRGRLYSSLKSDGVAVSRWTHDGELPMEVANVGSDTHHCIGLNLKCTSLTFAHGGRRLVQGRVIAGAVQVTAPAIPVNAVFESAADVLHLFVAQPVLRECYEDIFGRQHAGDIVLGNPQLIRDPVLERLSQALAVSQTSDAALGKVFTDSVCLAIVSRLVARHFAESARRPRGAAALPQWRMNRVVEFVEARLTENIGLADMARSAGLTRMHFAAQFRRATGLRPHEYLLRRRIEHAQQLLRMPAYSVIDVALCSGFRSQAHFTTVFKRFVGETPACWRVKAGIVR